ncbi:hypothetical protein [Vampirovibrio sp.]|uniref:hypothetical protein n=1 Tax=Vampirovibrio sp. TaxID=2717857 RepID=UPI00359363C5
MSSVAPLSTGGTPTPFLRRSSSSPNLGATGSTPLSAPDKPDLVSIGTETTPAAKPAQTATTTAKPFYQPLIDFFQNLGQKIMDLFTPTSQAAIEKALIQSKIKLGTCSTRIDKAKQDLKMAGLSDVQKSVLNQEIQKAGKKLEKCVAQVNKLHTKLDKRTGPLTQAAPPKAAAEVKSNVATATQQQAETVLEEASNLANEQSGAKTVQEAAQSILEGTDEDLAQQFEKLTSQAKASLPELIDTLKASCPELVETVTDLLKKMAR